ncbi:hypothetical protein BJF85_08115 [Saccharomonospora sp. CUA-673]|nr:hypothetical protein BJF85_08115 [Saccharomonospora sp. CUA-673]
MHPGGQPPKSKTGLIVGLSLGGVALLVGGFAILAWVAPGFLLDDEDNNADGANPGPTAEDTREAPPSYPADPEEGAQRFVEAINSGDADAASTVACEIYAESSAETAQELIDAGAQLEIESSERSDDGYVTFLYHGTDESGNIGRSHFFRQDDDTGGWCAVSMYVATRLDG